MHLMIASVLVLVSLRFVKKENWQIHSSTMLYVALMASIGSYLMCGKLLWEFIPGILPNHKAIDLLYITIVCPMMALLYLSYNPKKTKNRVLYHFAWVLASSLIELMLYLKGYITYHFGWSVWWSAGFYAVMFFMIPLHHTKPLLTYLLSAICAAILMVIFAIPLV